MVLLTQMQFHISKKLKMMIIVFLFSLKIAEWGKQSAKMILHKEG